MRTTFKKGSFILVLVLLMAITMLTLKSECQAAEGMYRATIVYVGPASGSAYLCATSPDGIFTNKWFSSTYSSDVSRALAVALTAASLGKNVYISTDTSTVGNNAVLSYFSAIYIIN